MQMHTNHSPGHHIPSYSLGSIFYQFTYGFIPVWQCNLCIFIVMNMYSHCVFMYNYPDWDFSVLFPQLQGKCQGKTRKDGTRPALFLIFELFYVFFVFYVFLCCFMYCLFCVVLCIVCVYMCTELLPPGG
jgi:hypothetical protein